MSLSARLDTAPAGPVHGAPCSVAQLRTELPTDEAAALDRMLHELGWTARQVYEAVTAEGHYIGYQSIGKHRRGQCRCKATA